MKQTFQLKTALQQKLTPQMQQSLRILQLGSQELSDLVQAELDENPLLEELDRTDDDATAAYNNPDHSAPQSDYAGDAQLNNHADDSGSIEFEPHWEEMLASKQLVGVSERANEQADQNDAMQNLSANESLVSHLLWQIRMTSLSERDVSIARVILHNLDEAGYLMSELSELVASFPADLDIEENEVNAVLSLIKTLEPLGVGTRNLAERLAVLLKHQFSDHPQLPIALEICARHLDLLAKKNLVEIRSQLNCNAATLEKAIRLITSVSPRITSNFGDLNQHQITPDLIVKKHASSGAWVVLINPVNQHRLRVNQKYAALLKTPLDATSSDFIRDKLQQAKTFIKNLMSRYDTLLLVAQTIVERQVEFFESGELGLKAMVLSDVADDLDLHESTISRATAGKYLQCPLGVFELKYFFSNSVGSEDGEGASSTAVRSLIKRIIQTEDKTKPLSDNKIASALAAQEHIIARRTVAKYRESLNIPPASQRKSMVT